MIRIVQVHVETKLGKCIFDEISVFLLLDLTLCQLYLCFSFLFFLLTAILILIWVVSLIILFLLNLLELTVKSFKPFGTIFSIVKHRYLSPLWHRKPRFLAHFRALILIRLLFPNIRWHLDLKSLRDLFLEVHYRFVGSLDHHSFLQQLNGRLIGLIEL